MTLISVCRSLRTGSTWPWWSTVSSCGSSCWCVWSGQWASSCSLSFRVTTPPLLMTWTITELRAQRDPGINFEPPPHPHPHPQKQCWQHFNTWTHTSASHHTLTGKWLLCTLNLFHHLLPPLLTPYALFMCPVILFSTRLPGGLGLIHFSWVNR